MIGEFFGPARLVAGSGLAAVTATAPPKPRGIPMNSPAKLTDTQRAILFEASERKDRCLIAPKTLKAAATQKVAAKLLKEGTSCIYLMTFRTRDADAKSRFAISVATNGGTGARPGKDGLSATAYPSGVKGTPVEIVETTTPLLFWAGVPL